MTPKRLELLARYLTVPETYFFRETACLDALATEILPTLMHSRRLDKLKLRFWSAGCCTGEETYSIAIVLMRTISDWKAWDISILGTDLNPLSLSKAREGIYGEWSFRGAPPWLKTQYFKPTPDGRWEILPHLKQGVRFEQLNLADGTYPSTNTGTSDIDVIFCGNVLMYFSDAQAHHTLEKFCRAQADGGWLIVGPNDIPRVCPPGYQRTHLLSGMIYRKTSAPLPPPFPYAPLSSPASASLQPYSTTLLHRAYTAPTTPPSTPGKAAEPVVPTPTVPASPFHPPSASHPPSSLAHVPRDLANQGRLDEALQACDLWIAADKTNASSHYMRAVILLELGQLAQAAAALRTVIYIQPDLVMAHFTLGNITHAGRQHRETQKHMSNVIRLLSVSQPDDTVPESDGMTAKRLMQIAAGILQPEPKP